MTRNFSAYWWQKEEFMPRQKMQPMNYLALAAERGFTWLGPEVGNVLTKTNWRCPQRHEWPAPYSRIQKGSGCPECAELGKIGRSTKPKEDKDYLELASQFGFTWLGPRVANNKINTNWQCPEGHEWSARYSTIQQGAGCPECSGHKPKIAEDYRALAEQRGFTWLGPEVDNTAIKTSWRCPQGHQWPAPYFSIMLGHGCPECAEVKSEVVPFSVEICNPSLGADLS